MMKTTLRIGVLAAAMTASACVSVLPEAAPPKPRFHIMSASSDVLAGEALSWSLVIDEPRATRVYDNSRVAVASAPGRTEYLSGAEWADRAPRLFQTALVQTFQDAGRIIAVGDRNAIPVARYVLQTDIRQLELNVASGANTAVVSVFARFSDGKGAVYAARRFDANVNAGSSKPDAVFTAFDAAFDTVLTDIVAWSYEVGANAKS